MRWVFFKYRKSVIEGVFKKATTILVSRETAWISRDVALITPEMERINNATPISVTVPTAMVCESTIRQLYTKSTPLRCTPRGFHGYSLRCT